VVPLVPATVKAAVPAVALAAALTVSLEVAAAVGLGVTDAGEKPHEMPVGSPAQASATAELNPPAELTVTV
jgi:hypothetical protein